MCMYRPMLNEATATWGPACTLHHHPWPCPHDPTGCTRPPLADPADVPVHVDRIPDRATAVAYARTRTRGLRPVVVHTDFGTLRLHHPSPDCWCHPEVTR